jgi:hypothetical protein
MLVKNGGVAGELCKTNQVLSVLSNMEDAQVLEAWAQDLEKRSAEPPLRLGWSGLWFFIQLVCVWIVVSVARYEAL